MTIEEIYEELGGDINDLNHRLGSLEFGERFLKKYADSGVFESMIEAYEASNYERVFIHSHNLKGMSANLSLMRMNETISAICEEVREANPSDKLGPLIDQAKEEHSKLKKLIEKL